MKSFNIRRRIGALGIASCMALATAPLTVSATESTTEPLAELSSEQPTVVITRIGDVDSTSFDDASTYASKTYVNRAGALLPGQSFSASFELTGWFGNDFVIEAGSGNTGGSLTLEFVSKVYRIPCDGQERVICSETGWPSGRYSFTIMNVTDNTAGYTIKIYKP